MRAPFLSRIGRLFRRVILYAQIPRREADYGSIDSCQPIGHLNGLSKIHL